MAPFELLLQLLRCIRTIAINQRLYLQHEANHDMCN